jgi:polar amino acid transport system substrate-binding protein
MDLSYPPFEMVDPSGNPAGVSVDLAKALAESLGRELKIENIPFVGLIPTLQNGRLDCVISSLSDTPARREAISFSAPYVTVGLALLVGKNSPVQSIADLDQPGRTIVVRQGTTGEIWARKNLKQAKILAVDKENSAVLEVSQGRADAFIYDQMSVWKNSQENPTTTRALLQPVEEQHWAIGLRKGNEELKSQIDAFLTTFREKGGFQALGDKYLPAQKKAFAEQGVPFVF